MKTFTQEAAQNMYNALKTIALVRDYHAEHGAYPAGYMEDDQEFDDWAADVAEQATEGL